MAPRIPASERDFLDLVDRHFPNEHPHMPMARGDDCARLACGGDLVLSTDLFVEDVHFRRSYFAPGDIGHKALAVNVSDIAAMGCRPLGFSLGLMAPAAAPPDDAYWDELFAGMAALARRFDAPLTGGDLSMAPALGLCVTIWGEPGPTGRVLARDARPGDAILCVGGFGAARAGLMALEELGPEAAGRYPHAVAAHLRPAPLVDEGLTLAAEPGVSGCMDLSDGLARDLPRLMPPGLGAALDIAADSLHPDVTKWCHRTGEDPVAFAFLGGEDYALLAAAAPEAVRRLIRDLPGAMRIGTVTEAPGITLNGGPVPGLGFDHFSHD